MLTNPFLVDLYESLGRLEHDFRNANLVRLVASHVRGSRVLDVGCGSGALPAFLADRGLDAWGLEPDGELVRLAAKWYPGVRVIHGTADDLDVLDESFDTVTSVDVVEHIEDDVAALAAMRDRLVPGGRLVLVVPAHPWLFGERDRLNGHFRRYTRRDLTEKLRHAGLRVDRLRSWNALGVLPYWYSERIRGRPLESKLRTAEAGGWRSRIARGGLHTWLRQVENRHSFGFGLSLLAVATRDDERPAAERRRNREVPARARTRSSDQQHVVTQSGDRRA